MKPDQILPRPAPAPGSVSRPSRAALRQLARDAHASGDVALERDAYAVLDGEAPAALIRVLRAMGAL